MFIKPFTRYNKTTRERYTVYKKRYDLKQGIFDWETVNLSSLKNKDAREIGAEWLCKQAFDQLGIGNFLREYGWDEEKIAKDVLYGISHKLNKIKDPLEQYLLKRTNELFDLDDKIILYDLTNTYFEGRILVSKIAKFGRL